MRPLPSSTTTRWSSRARRAAALLAVSVSAAFVATGGQATVASATTGSVTADSVTAGSGIAASGIAGSAVSVRSAVSASDSPLAVGRTARFRHLAVTLTRSDRASDSYFYGAKVKVCVTSLPKGSSSLRLSWDPWSITADHTSVQPGGFEEGTDPWVGHEAPLSKTYRVGQCMQGYVPFGVAGTAQVTKVSYANSLGNRASWTVTNGASPQHALGTTVTFPHFSVTVSKASQDERGFRAYVTTCVRSLPAGSTAGRTRLSWDPFTANAGSHFGFAPYVYDASHTWSHLYRQSGYYRVGQCARGWVPFEGVDESLPIDRLAYRNSLGDQALWEVG